MKTLKHPLPDKLGRIIPVAGIVYNPTHEWLEAIWRFPGVPPFATGRHPPGGSRC